MLATLPLGQPAWPSHNEPRQVKSRLLLEAPSLAYRLRRIAEATSKAGSRRLARELCDAAWLLQQTAGYPQAWRRAYVLGAVEACGSLTLKAALLTAWGL